MGMANMIETCFSLGVNLFKLIPS